MVKVNRLQKIVLDHLGDHVVGGADQIIGGGTGSYFRIHDLICLKLVIDNLDTGFLLKILRDLRVHVLTPVIDIDNTGPGLRGSICIGGTLCAGCGRFRPGTGFRRSRIFRMGGGSSGLSSRSGFLSTFGVIHLLKAAGCQAAGEYADQDGGKHFVSWLHGKNLLQKISMQVCGFYCVLPFLFQQRSAAEGHPEKEGWRAHTFPA